MKTINNWGVESNLPYQLSEPNHYRNLLKSKVSHISFSNPHMTIDDMTEDSARKLLEMLNNNK